MNEPPLTPHAILISTADAARRLSISTKTLRNHVDDGTIPHVKIGRGKKRMRFGFDPNDIAQFIRNRKQYESKLPCQSIGAKGKRNIHTTSKLNVVDLRETLERLRNAKRNAPKKP